MPCLVKGFGIFSVGLLTFGVHFDALAEAKITLEKNCVVKIEGDVFAVGDSLNVMRTVKGTKKKVATVKVTKLGGPGVSVGRAQGLKTCKALKGLLVESSQAAPAMSAESGVPPESPTDTAAGGVPSGGTEGSAAGGTLPRYTVSLTGGMIMLSPENVHLQVGNNSKMTLIGTEFSADAFPLMHLGTSALYTSVGFGIRTHYGMAIPQIQVQDPDNADSVGKQQTNPMDVEFDIIGRYPFMNNSLIAEARVSPYYSHKLTHKVTSGALQHSPLRDINYTGFGFGLNVAYRATSTVAVKAGFMFPLALKGKTPIVAGDSGANTSTILKSPSGLRFALSGEYNVYKMINLIAGFSRASYKSTLEVDGTAATPDGEFVKISQSYMFFHGGVGANF